jgi:hypothetical protein
MQNAEAEEDYYLNSTGNILNEEREHSRVVGIQSNDMIDVS